MDPDIANSPVWGPHKNALTQIPSLLEIADASNVDVGSWSAKDSWRPSAQPDGTPGFPPRQPGDANRDGLFNTADLALVLVAGEYDDAILGNSTFAEGDFDGDGDFTRLDLVLAHQYGRFVTL